MHRGQVRIIGGQWRGRKLSVPKTAAVRPTPDRVRETLFNWLLPILPGARCLDLFAGSGALGFEALSRGAAYALLVDQSPKVVKQLKEQREIFGAVNAQIFQASLPEHWGFLTKAAVPVFDVVFLDPPYHENLLLPICFALEERKLLAETAYIYLESDKALENSELPQGWTLIKAKKAGQVGYYLAKREGVGHDNKINSNS